MADWSRRKAEHAALAGIAATLGWAALEELSSRRTVRTTGLLVLATAAMGGLMASKASSKAYAVENRFNHLLDHGGRFGGDVHVAGNHTVDGDHHVQGSIGLTGNSGFNANGNPVNTQGGNINTGNGNVNGASWPQGAGNNFGHSNATTVAGLRADTNNLIDNLNNLRGQMKGSGLFN